MASSYSIEAVFNLIDKITKPMSNINKQGDIVNSNLKKTFSNAQKYADKFSGRLKSLGSGLLKLAGVSAFLNFDSIKNFLMADITNALELSDTMAKISTVVDATAPPLGELQKNLFDVANQAGFTVKELAAIAYTAIPSGIAAEASANFAATVAKTAKVTGTASDKIVDGLTTAINAYGMGADEAARISGMMFTANKLGKTSFEDMAAGMKNVIPVAAQFGVATEDVFASVTALTAKGLTTKDAMKTLGDSISAVTHPSKDAAALAQRLGLDFSQAALESKGWAGFLEDVRKKTGGNTKILETLFGNEKVARSMGILATTGAQAFNDALAEMGNAINTIDEQFMKATDTPAERWKKAMNKISNAGTSLGTALLPVVERVIGKVSEIADRIAALDFSQIAGVVDAVFAKIESFANVLWGAIQIAWQFRGVIFAVIGVIMLYRTVQLLMVGAAKLFTFWENAKRVASIITAIAFGTQTAALGSLKSGTLGYLIVDKAFQAATKVKTALLTFLTGGTLAQSAATASMAVANGTATASQWLLNAAMNANPIGLVIAAIAALIAIIVILVRNWDRVSAAVKNNVEKVLFFVSLFTGPVGFVVSVIKELFNNWHRVTEAFENGGILAAIKKIGAVILSGILSPVQGLLEILSHIPGLGKLAGKGAEKIAEVRNSLLGEDSNITAKIKMPKIEVPPVEPDLSAYEQKLTSMEIPGLDIPEIDMPEINMPDMNIPGMGKSKLRGVVDISGGARASVIPNLAAGETSGTYTVNSAVSPPGVIDNTSQVLLGIDRTVQAVSAFIKNIDTTATAILNTILQPVTITAIPPALNAPAQRTRTPYRFPVIPDGGQREREEADREDPRNIPPVSREERMAYSLQERRDTVGIEVSAARGSQARIVRRPRSPNIQLTTSGGNV